MPNVFMNCELESCDVGSLETGEPLGSHVIAEFHQCTTSIDCPDLMESILVESAIKAKATVMSSHTHNFGENMGVTGVVILAESHISIHTWPEYQYAAVDVFMCGKASPEVAVEHIRERLNPLNIVLKNMARGQRSIQ